jgi:hypothetical protein
MVNLEAWLEDFGAAKQADQEIIAELLSTEFQRLSQELHTRFERLEEAYPVDSVCYWSTMYKFHSPLHGRPESRCGNS